MCVYVGVCAHVCMYVHVWLCVHVGIVQACVHVCVCVCTCASAGMGISLLSTRRVGQEDAPALVRLGPQRPHLGGLPPTPPLPLPGREPASGLTCLFLISGSLFFVP